MKLTQNLTFIQSEFDTVSYTWVVNEMNDMLGKIYEVLLRPSDDLVALPSLNGEQNGKWYFPKTAVSCNCKVFE